MNRPLTTTVLLAAGALTCAAGAEMYTAAGGSVTDNNAVGNNFSLDVGESLIVSDISVTLTNFKHTYMGQLTASLTHVPSGASISLFEQIGKTGTKASAGDSSDFLYDYTFADGGSNLWAAAKAGGTSTKMAAGEYYATGSGVGSNVSVGPEALSFASTFAGIDAQGEWVLNISDRAKNTTLNSDWSWSLNVASIPGPGAMALVGAAGLVGFGRRRRL